MDTVVQSLRCLPDLDGLVIAESAVALKGVPLSGLRLRLSGRNDERERRIVSAIVPQSQSIIECMARYWLRSAGFHVESQVNIPGMGHIDLMVDGKLGIETDGAGFHMDRTSFEEDRRRWNVMTRRGIPILVVSYSLLLNRPEEFIGMVRDALNRSSVAA
ncbi:very-short-patch-repair endonuclease [Arthrobacter sp. UYCu512]|uniref:endonuclease domain-containing protein n=1 Tax=Arthrobacter sp. UYCu512 TaxID=3156338 RepID=UPI00339AC2E6